MAIGRQWKTTIQAIVEKHDAKYRKLSYGCCGSLTSQLSSTCLCQGCLVWWFGSCSKMRKHHRSSQCGLLGEASITLFEIQSFPGENFYLGGSHGESGSHSPPAQKTLPHSFTTPFSQSSSTTCGVLEMAHTEACELTVKFQKWWEPAGFTLVAMVGAQPTNQPPSHHSQLHNPGPQAIVKHLLVHQGPTTLKLKYQAPFSS